MGRNFVQNLKKVVFLLVCLLLCLTFVSCSSNNQEEQDLPDNVVTIKLWKGEQIIKETQVEKGTILSENSDMFLNLFYDSEKLLFWTEDKNSLQPYNFNRTVDANLNLWAITEYVQYYDLKYVEMKTNLNGFIYDLENLSSTERFSKS